MSQVMISIPKDGVEYTNIGKTFLTFDGENLTLLQQVEDEDGEKSVSSTLFEAKSGLPNKETGNYNYSINNQKVKNKGPIPGGDYRLHKFGSDENGKGFASGYKDLEGRAYYIGLTPIGHNAFDRKSLEIHPDGNVPGTLGCIGIQCQIPNLPKKFYDSILKTLSGIPFKKRPFLHVQYNYED